MVLALCNFSDGRQSMYQVSLIPSYTFRDMLRTSFSLQKNKKGSYSVYTGDRVMALAFCNFLIALYHCIKFHLFIFNTFRDMLQTRLQLQKLEREITL